MYMQAIFVTILLIHVLDAPFSFYLHAFVGLFSFPLQHADVVKFSYMPFPYELTHVYHTLDMRTFTI